MSDEDVPEAAAARSSDFSGTAAADEGDVTAGVTDMYAKAGLDRDRWSILAVDVRRWQGVDAVAVYAIDHAKYEISGRSQLMALAAKLGHLPVVRFRVPAENVQDFIDASFERFSMRLVHHDAEGFPLTVVGADGSGTA
ncbi:hypothetical protein [Georgenia sp. AZ-5]|uniref:hypothetical protein n=1 Tax=Georgenia sp. AZ-5 TaxID=3367526 RepID=UPI0037540219